MNIWSSFDCVTIPHDSRGFKKSDRSVGLAGINCSLALAGRRGIEDRKFRDGVAEFREEPATPSRLMFDTRPGDLGHLQDLLDRCHAGNMPGAPEPGSRNLREVTAAKLAPYLPCYRMPAGDAVSVPDFLDALSIGIGQTGRAHSPSCHPKPRRPPLPFKSPRPAGDVSWENVEEFAEYHYSLRGLLMRSLSWQRRGRRAFTPADSANAIARSILGIDVDLRVGSLLKAAEVTAATRLAAGYSPEWDDTAIRVRHFVTARVPKVRPAGRPHEADLGSARGAAWSVALDRALNDPLVWRRNANDWLTYMSWQQ